MAGAVSPPETLAGFEATVTQWLKQNGSPVTLTKMKGVSGWLLALPEGPTLQVFREEVTPSTPACDQCRILGEPWSRCRCDDATVYRFKLRSRDGRAVTLPAPVCDELKPAQGPSCIPCTRLGWSPSESCALPLHHTSRGGMMGVQGCAEWEGTQVAAPATAPCRAVFTEIICPLALRRPGLDHWQTPPPWRPSRQPALAAVRWPWLRRRWPPRRPMIPPRRATRPLPRCLSAPATYCMVCGKGANAALHA